MRYVTIIIGMLVSYVTSASLGDTIGVNFYSTSHESHYSTLSPTDEPGVQPGANWNNVGEGWGVVTRTGIALQNDQALPTAAVLGYTTTCAYGGKEKEGSALPSSTAQMHRDFLAGNDALEEVRITVEHIPYEEYDLYVFCSTGGAPNEDGSLSLDGGDTLYFHSSERFEDADGLVRTTSVDPLAPTEGAIQYQLFEGLTSSSFTVRAAGSQNGVYSVDVHGLHIVEVPEPATMSLLALGGMAMLKRRGR